MPAEPDIDIRRLDSCTFGEALRLWNEGFGGYPFDMTLTLDAYLSRFPALGLSPELSLAAFVGGRPAGFVINGVREVGGARAAWNGGTGVAPEFRGRGLGKLLVSAALEVYRERGAEAATLEALAGNARAVSLYEGAGYVVTDRLLLLERRGRLDADSFGGGGDEYRVERVPAHEAGRLDFYDESAPWQSHWQSVERGGGEALLVFDASGVAAYALYRRSFDAGGGLAGVTLYQCVGAPGREREAPARALREVYSPPEAECRRAAHNLGASACAPLLRSLGDAGFAVYGEQVHMRIDLRRAA